MISNLFITRTRLAMVVSVVIALAGALALSVLPVQQYPNITPPTVNVSATYPGASAEVIADVVGGPLDRGGQTGDAEAVDQARISQTRAAKAIG